MYLFYAESKYNSAQEMQHKGRVYWAIRRATDYDIHIEQ